MTRDASGPFDRWTDRDLADLVAAYPLAWVVSAQPQFQATPLPVLLETDDEGRPQSLLGHFAKRNPQVEAIRSNPRTLFLFSGPQGYISPELVTTTRDWAPTWNYATARILADVEFDEKLNDEALQTLVQTMERDRQDPWRIAELGERYEGMKRAIIAFRARIVSVDARFKLGQDERDEVFDSIVRRLGETELAEWMLRFNAERS